jgi:hypothetical protein
VGLGENERFTPAHGGFKTPALAGDGAEQLTYQARGLHIMREEVM